MRTTVPIAIAGAAIYIIYKRGHESLLNTIERYSNRGVAIKKLEIGKIINLR